MPYLPSFFSSAGGALLFGLALVVQAPDLSGAEVTNLYTVQVSVDQEADDPRQDGFKQAMAELLVRLTGRRDAATDPALFELMDSASRFVQRWGFATQELLAVTFDGRAVEDALALGEQPVWGKDRPLTLVWIALDAGRGERRLLSGLEQPSEDDPGTDLLVSVLEQVTNAAERRGLPLAFPLLDSEDLALVTFADVWGGFTSRIRAASRRYQADGVLVGRVHLVGGVATARWRYLGPNEQRERRSSVGEGVEWLADIYASQYAVTGRSGLARLVVTGVLSFDDYARVMRHLESLSIIDSVSVDELHGDQLILALETRAKADVLERALSLGSIIAPVATPFGDPLGLPLEMVSARYFQVLR